ncbi:MAG: hypothetical protein NTW49_00205 [Bacteroidia bacterium]|nr:hypothetical protein [Bacteroidia bacterium]
MKIIQHFLIVLSLVLVVISCKKDETKSRTELLTGKYWITTAVTIDPAVNINGTLVTDIFAQEETCRQDDLQKFTTNGVYTFDEGASKCSANDPQTTNGIWSFNSDDTILSITDNGVTDSYTIISINSMTIVAKYSEVADYGSGAMTYTYTVTSQVH